MKPRTPILIPLALAFSLHSARNLAETFNVSLAADLSDSNPGDGSCQVAAPGDPCTLRAAVEEANALAGQDTINVPADTYELTLLNPGTLTITDDVRILGDRVAETIVDGSGNGTVFVILGQRRGRRERIRVELHHLVIQNGNADDAGGIHNFGGRLLVNRSTVSFNQAFSQGAGISNGGGGILSLVRSTVAFNGDAIEGGRIGFPARSGGLHNHPGAIAFLDKSTLMYNNANRFGGALNLGLLIARNSTISHNRGDVDTGGVANNGTAYLNNVTIAWNEVFHDEDGNDTSAGGLSNSGALSFANTIVAHNSHVLDERHDCSGTLTSFGYNLVSDTEGCDLGGDLTGVILDEDETGLGILGSYGGETQTHFLTPDSIARDAGNPAFPTGVGTACEPTDQRFRLRGVGPGVGRCDMGAYERGGAPGEEANPDP